MSLIQIITKQLQLNTRLFRNVLVGITDEHSVTKLSKQINHLCYIAGHLTGSRYRNLLRLGLKPEPFVHIEKYFIPDKPPPGARPIDDSIDYPGLNESLRYWNIYSDEWINAVQKLPDEQLLKEGAFATPVGKLLLDTYAFYAVHEAYHLGQMSIIRKGLGYPAMSFTD